MRNLSDSEMERLEKEKPRAFSSEQLAYIDKQEKEQEYISDVVVTTLSSNCCSAAVYSPSGDWAVCMGCHEPCEAVQDE